MQSIGLKENVHMEIIEWAQNCGIQKVILFGSRARMDYREKSDIDLAVTGGDVIRFSAEIDDRISTLLMFDIVNLDGSVQSELLDSIEKEGVTIYEEDGE